MGKTPAPPESVIERFPWLKRIHDKILSPCLAEADSGSGLDCDSEKARGELVDVYLDLIYDGLPRHCNDSACPLSTSSEWGDKIGKITIPRIVPGYGSPRADVMFIAEGPGSGERNTGIPLVGPDEIMNSECVNCKHFRKCFRTIVPR